MVWSKRISNGPQFDILNTYTSTDWSVIQKDFPRSCLYISGPNRLIFSVGWRIWSIRPPLPLVVKTSTKTRSSLKCCGEAITTKSRTIWTFNRIWSNRWIWPVRRIELKMNRINNLMVEIWTRNWPLTIWCFQVTHVSILKRWAREACLWQLYNRLQLAQPFEDCR